MPSNTDFESVEYVELDEIEAAKLVEQYNKQAEADRLQLLVENRMKKNEEKSKKFILFLK